MCCPYTVSTTFVSQLKFDRFFKFPISVDTRLHSRSVLMLFLAAIIWGVTNPLLKFYSAGFASDNEKKEEGVFGDVLFLLKRPKYLVCQITNLSGSVAFFYALQSVDLSLGSIVTNALAFVITVLMSVFVMKEGAISASSWCGIACVLAGISLCTLSKS